MKKYLLVFTLFIGSLFAENFSEMSTQELIAIMGYVKPANEKAFMRELKSRLSTMSDKERQQYQKNLKRLKK